MLINPYPLSHSIKALEFEGQLHRVAYQRQGQNQTRVAELHSSYSSGCLLITGMARKGNQDISTSREEWDQLICQVVPPNHKAFEESQST